MICVLVGLGNPGSEYEGTRHNIGFEVLDLMAYRRDAIWHDESRFKALVARTNFGPAEGPGLPVWFIKPQTFMNNSGDSVAAFFAYHKLGPSSLLVISDDATLPLGRLRLRPTGSAGGHNGLASIEEKIGPQQFARLRCGVGQKPDAWDLADWVLGKFRAEERTAVEETIHRATEAAECAVLHGIEAAMNDFNGESRPPEVRVPRNGSAQTPRLN